MNHSFEVPQVRSKSGNVELSSPDCDKAKASLPECVGAKVSTPDWIGASSRGREDSGSTWDVDAPGEQSRFHWNIGVGSGLVNITGLRLGFEVCDPARGFQT